MKRLLVLMTAFLLLTACGAKTDVPAELPEDEFALPETTEAAPVSAEAIVTEGRIPTEAYDLPKEGVAHIQDWVESGGVGLLSETEAAAFYGLPVLPGTQETALICWGESQSEFDWDFMDFGAYLPQMAVMDLDRDGEEELVVLIYQGGGLGASAWELHVLERSPEDSLTDYAMPESLWSEQVSSLLQFVQTGGRRFLVLGQELLELEGVESIEEMQEPSVGWNAKFRFLPEENAVEFSGKVDLWYTTNYVADYTANVGYQNGEFTLFGFHLQ